MSTIRCTAEYRDGNEALTASSVFTEFIADLPSDAALSPISIEQGTQRDPWQVLVGLRATWDEER